ncbi:MAG: hypothetical protein ACLFUS_14760 [Candidatus Sumerlaeia bacterium]
MTEATKNQLETKQKKFIQNVITLIGGTAFCVFLIFAQEGISGKGWGHSGSGYSLEDMKKTGKRLEAQLVGVLGFSPVGDVPTELEDEKEEILADVREKNIPLDHIGLKWFVRDDPYMYVCIFIIPEANPRFRVHSIHVRKGLDNWRKPYKKQVELIYKTIGRTIY